MTEGTAHGRSVLDVASRLQELLAELDFDKLLLLERMADALSVPVEVAREASDLVDDAFASGLSNFLLIHHAIHEEPLNKAAFEYVMKGCSMAGGHTAELNANRGSGTWDIQVDAVKWSLKTEAAKGISPNILKIEKLMEARWIRECTNPAKCASAVRREIPKHLSGYDRVLALRASVKKDGSIRYDLVEPPIEVLRDRLENVGMDVFTKEGSKESYGANIEDEDGNRIFRILLDSSVEKVRLWFNISQCRRHGSWLLQPSAVREAAATS